MRPVVYISGPLSNGLTLSREERLKNVDIPAKVMAQLIRLNYAPYCPHLTEHLETHTGETFPHEVWMEIDKAIIVRCDVLLRLPGESKGADIEVAYAQEIGIPVVYGTEALEEWRLYEGR